MTGTELFDQQALRRTEGLRRNDFRTAHGRQEVDEIAVRRAEPVRAARVGAGQDEVRQRPEFLLTGTDHVDAFEGEYRFTGAVEGDNDFRTGVFLIGIQAHVKLTAARRVAEGYREDVFAVHETVRRVGSEFQINVIVHPVLVVEEFLPVEVDADAVVVGDIRAERGTAVLLDVVHGERAAEENRVLSAAPVGFPLHTVNGAVAERCHTGLPFCGIILPGDPSVGSLVQVSRLDVVPLRLLTDEILDFALCRFRRGGQTEREVSSFDPYGKMVIAEFKCFPHFVGHRKIDFGRFRVI